MDGNPIPNKTIKVLQGSSFREILLNASGEYFEAFASLYPTTIDITVIFEGDGVYMSSTNKTRIIVKDYVRNATSIIFDPIDDVPVGSPVTVGGKIIDNNASRPIGDLDLVVTVDGTEHRVTTSTTTGLFTIPGLTFDTPHKVNVTARFDENHYYLSSEANTSFNVYPEKIATNITITAPDNILPGEEVIITFFLHDLDNNPIKYTNISVSFGADFVPVTVDENGKFEYTTDDFINVGEYLITAKIESNDLVIGSTNTTVLKVNSPSKKKYNSGYSGYSGYICRIKC